MPEWGRGSTRASRKVRDRVLRRDNYQCQIRGPNCLGVATEDDHILSVGQGGGDEYANHQAACSKCHREKSNREAYIARMAKKQNEKRKPPLHPGG